MAVVNVTVDIEGITGTHERRGKKTFVVPYNVTTDDTSDGPDTVCSAAGLPDILDSYAVGNDSVAGALLSSKSARRASSKDRKQWVVTCNYSTLEGDDDSEAENPLDRPLDISWGSNSYTEPVDKDINGDPIDSSAGEPFDPSVERENSRPVLTVVKNQASFTASTKLDYENRINADTFYGAEPGWAKMADIQAQKAYENGVSYWRVTYQIEFKPGGWTKEVLDQGFYKLTTTGEGESATTQKELIKDKDNLPLNQPALLDGSGGELAANADPVFLDFEVYETAVFGQLGIE